MTKTFFTSDLHLSHKLVAGLRGFEREDERQHEFGLYNVMVPIIDEHNTRIADNWDRVVSDEDRVFVLGDVAMKFTHEVAAWIRARPGRKILIAGNHDEVASFHSKASQAQRAWMGPGLFDSIHDFLQIKVGGRRVALSHYPYSGEGERPGEDRFTQWRLRDEGMALIHGHTHSPVVHEVPYSFHVGLDAHNLELVPENQIIAWLNTLQ